MEIFTWVSSSANVLVLTMKILAFILPFALAIGGWFYWYMKRGRFKIHVEIEEQGSSGLIIHKDRGRISKDKSGQVRGFELAKYEKWDGRNIPTDFFETHIVSGGLFGGVSIKRKLRFFMDEEGNIHPIKPLNKWIKDGNAIKLNSEWQGLTNSERIMLSNSYQRMKDKYATSSWWEKNGALVMQIGSAVILILGFFMIVNQLGDIAASNVQMAEAVNQGLQAIGHNVSQVIK